MPRDHGIIRLLTPYHASAVLPKSITSMKSGWPLMSTAWSVQFCTDSRRNPGVVSPGKLLLGKPHRRQGYSHIDLAVVMQSGNILDKFRLSFDPNHPPNRDGYRQCIPQRMLVHDLS
jgi:hypothetical protein